MSDFLNMSDEEFSKSEPATIEGDSVESSTGSEEVMEDDSQEYTDGYEEEAYYEYDDDEDSEGDDEIDSRGDVNTLFEPMKAAGMDFQVKNVDEARKLIQMGLDYNQKMSAIKPHRKLLKMLENNELLDESKLNYLIDLAAGNKNAIAKLVKDTEFDPYEISDEDEEYTPSNHTVSDTAVELDEVIDSIRTSPSFADTMAVVTRQWDESSKAAIAQNPKRLAVLNHHIESGLFKVVQERVQRERIMGNLSGVSDYAAYDKVGEMLYQEGALSEYFPEQKPTTVSRAPVGNTHLNSQRKKAAVTRGNAPSSRKGKKPTALDILNMSDDDFAKFKPY